MPEKKQSSDPYETYTDGFCRDVSGQIVPCESESAVSPAKHADGSVKVPAAGATTDKK
jgi:hypothetical protein